MKLAFFMIFAFSCSLGLLYFFGLLKYIVLNGRENSYKFCEIIIIPISGHLENIEFLVRKNLNDEQFLKNKDIIFLDRGLECETKTILNRLSKYHNFTICEKDEIYDVMQEKIGKIS